MNHEHSLARIAPLFLVLFIDGMGLSLLFPIINSIIIDPSSHFLPFFMPLATREFLYGLVIGIYMICWFFGAAILGDLSDICGRKKSLMICLAGACIGYGLSGIAIGASSIVLLIVGRVIAGFTAGSQPIAQAAIVDVSSEEHKARNIGFILLSVSMGFILGPLLGGVLSDNHVVSWFSFSTPMYFAALLSLLNMLLLQMLFKETFVKSTPIKIKLSRAVTVFIEAFQHKKIRKLSIVMLFMILGWSNYYTFIPFYVHEKFHYTTLQQAYFMAMLGIGFSIGSAFLVDYFSKRFNNRNNVLVGMIIAAIFIGFVLFNINEVADWFFTIIIAASICVAYSIIITLFSDEVGPDEQGWVMGVMGSLMAFCFGVTAVLTGVLVQLGINLPLILAMSGLLLAAVLMLFLVRKK